MVQAAQHIDQNDNQLYSRATNSDFSFEQTPVRMDHIIEPGQPDLSVCVCVV